jgi:hypothetical protein
MIKSKYIFLGLIVLLFSSCEDFFETTIEIDPPEFTEQVVIQAFGNTNANELKVTVTRSYGILEDNDFEELLINDAEVNLIYQGTVYPLEATDFSFNEGEAHNYLLDEGIIAFEAGETYELEVIAAGFDTATASCTVPLSTLPHDITFELDGPSSFEDDYSRIGMVLNDPSGIENFYEMGMVAKFIFDNGDSIYSSLYTESFDPVIEESVGTLILKDASFDGEQKILELLLPRDFFISEPGLENRLFLTWRNTTEDHYRYVKSIEQNINTVDNPFASPVQVFTNVENGLGIFSIFTEEKIKIN